MNCEVCKNNLQSYLDGTIPPEIKSQIEAHLRTCSDCALVWYAEKVADKVITEEKSYLSNPFLTTRIMAGIENIRGLQQRSQPQPLYRRLVTPLIIGISIMIAVGMGIMQGMIYHVPVPELPLELIYLNDAALESVHAFSNP